MITEYAKTVIGVALITGMLTLLLQEGESARVFKFVCALFSLMCIVAPLTSLIPQIEKGNFSIREKEYSFSQTVDYTKTMLANDIKSSINSCVTKVIGESAKDITLTVFGDENSLQVENVKIKVDSAYSSRAGTIEAYVYERLGIKSEVIS